MNTELKRRPFSAVLVLGALGVVYGDIGTSPLYALRECFHGPKAPALTPENVIGVLSLITWTLIAVVSVKYLGFVLRAANQGEGGILALLALAVPERHRPSQRNGLLIGLGLYGAAMLYGDGVLTPSLTVLSAVEGLSVVTSFFDPYVVPITVAVLVGLFSIQRHGTGRVGQVFGPVMVLWFVVLAVLGINGLRHAPEVLHAVNPLAALRFAFANGWLAFTVLGSVFLVVTGAEALYADMGHFGRAPIRQAWFALVMPSLLLNYFGQGALLLRDPAAVENPFYTLAPHWARYPLVVLATAAAIIASQALISGVFSLTMQAVQLGYLPRLAVTHTSSEQRGQIYVAKANWTLLVLCVLLVVGFGSSTKLAGAYGIAVSLTMVITTVLFGVAARRMWGWSRMRVGVALAIFLTIELAFCGANLLKLLQGGWVPLVLAGAVFLVMTTWQRGRALLRERLSKSILPLEDFLASVARDRPRRVPGTAIFMSGNPTGAPLALLHNLKHNKVLHERNVLLRIATQESAHVARGERLQVDELSEGFYRVTGHYGFMDEPDVPELLAGCGTLGLKLRLADTTFFLSSESILAGTRPGLAWWRKRLFGVLSRNSQRATAFFRLPANRVVELGMQVEL
jgi:KUP system potassium uptake protein